MVRHHSQWRGSGTGSCTGKHGICRRKMHTEYEYPIWPYISHGKQKRRLCRMIASLVDSICTTLRKLSTTRDACIWPRSPGVGCQRCQPLLTLGTQTISVLEPSLTQLVWATEAMCKRRWIPGVTFSTHWLKGSTRTTVTSSEKLAMHLIATYNHN